MRKLNVAALLALALIVGACGSETTPEESPSAEETTTQPEATTSAPEETTEAPDECAPENLALKESGVLTVGIDDPAFPPYVVDNDPTNGQGFEPAVAYAVAEQLGFTEINWIRVPFNKSYAPGPKDFDFYLTQVSITPKRDEAVDFSDPYYESNQALIALKDNAVATATSIEDLKAYRLAAQIGTTSLAYINEVIQPTEAAYVFDTTNDAKTALNNDTIDGIVVDLPTAYYITAVEIPKATIVAQFALDSGGATDQWGFVLEGGSGLVDCVNQALATLRESGDLQAITEEWMSGGGDVPTLS
jgi:polar amino acid transport system substrate-binding protein